MPDIDYFNVYEEIHLIKRPMIAWPPQAGAAEHHHSRLWLCLFWHRNSLTKKSSVEFKSIAKATLQINDSQLAKRHYLSNRFVSFRSIFDDLNWTVWMQTDWYVEAYLKKPFYGSFSDSSQLQNKSMGNSRKIAKQCWRADQSPHQYLNILDEESVFASIHKRRGKWNQNKLRAKKIIFHAFLTFFENCEVIWSLSLIFC